MPSSLTDLKPVVINLDQGQQIIIEGDTIYKQIQCDDPNPAKCLLLEHGGRCVAFTFEDNVWWQSEFTGDANRIPQLNIKYRAVGKEKEEREQARERWKQERGQTECAHHAQQPAQHTAQIISTAAPLGHNQPYSRCDNGASLDFRGPSRAFVQMQTVQMQFPSARIESTNQYVDSELATNFIHTPGRHNQHQLHNPGYNPTQLWPNRPAYQTNRGFTPPPHFPEASSFLPARRPQSSPRPSFHPSEQTPFDFSANGRTQINGGAFVSIGGRVDDRNVDASINMSGQGLDVDISPDYHQELNGHFMPRPSNWPR